MFKTNLAENTNNTMPQTPRRRTLAHRQSLWFVVDSIAGHVPAAPSEKSTEQWGHNSTKQTNGRVQTDTTQSQTTWLQSQQISPLEVCLSLSSAYLEYGLNGGRGGQLKQLQAPVNSTKFPILHYLTVDASRKFP